MRTYYLTSTATYGTTDAPTYVQRAVEAVVCRSNAPALANADAASRPILHRMGFLRSFLFGPGPAGAVLAAGAAECRAHEKHTRHFPDMKPQTAFLSRRSPRLDPIGDEAAGSLERHAFLVLVVAGDAGRCSWSG